jgi:hypothetical protein
MNEDTKLGITPPLRYFPFIQRFPIGLILGEQRSKTKEDEYDLKK